MHTHMILQVWAPSVDVFTLITPLPYGPFHVLHHDLQADHCSLPSWTVKTVISWVCMFLFIMWPWDPSSQLFTIACVCSSPVDLEKKRGCRILFHTGHNCSCMACGCVCGFQLLGMLNFRLHNCHNGRHLMIDDSVGDIISTNEALIFFLAPVYSYDTSGWGSHSHWLHFYLLWKMFLWPLRSLTL